MNAGLGTTPTTATATRGIAHRRRSVANGMHIEIWSDVKCPWCFVGKRRFEKALAEFPHRDKVEVTWKSFQLDPNLPEHYEGTEQQYLSERKGIAPEQVRQMWNQLTSSAGDVGVNFDFDSVVVGNSFTAHRFLHLAKSQGLGTRRRKRSSRPTLNRDWILPTSTFS